MRNRQSRLGWTIVMVTAALLAPSLIPAQTTRSGGGGGQSAQLMQQMQQMATERTQLQSENARLKQELDALKSRQDADSSSQAALKQKAQAAEANASRLAAASSASADKAARLQIQVDELVAKYRELAQNLKDAETERGSLRLASQRAERDLGKCADANAQLITMNDEVLDRLEHTGFFTKLAADEPFTQLKRTELSNLADTYRTKAAELTVAPAAGARP